jgi:hypothetical protein
MNWIRKTIFFIGLSIAFAFAFSANEVPVSKIQIEKQNSSFSIESTHSSVFIQPRASSSFATPQKTINFSIVKYFENYLIVIPDYKIRRFFSLHVNQDINRCEMVSLLLFPFHYFW